MPDATPGNGKALDEEFARTVKLRGSAALIAVVIKDL